MRFSVPPAKAVVRDSSGTIVEPPEAVPSHHIGFRYYRLAQTCDDLFDSFRNMYLAFELLLSSSYPKVKEQEIQWLRRALTSSDSDLRLAQLVPRGTGDPVAYVIQTVYENARLPLFHAKDGRTYFTPFVSAADRAAVENALKLLTSIVVRMAEVGTTRGGSVAASSLSGSTTGTSKFSLHQASSYPLVSSLLMTIWAPSMRRRSVTRLWPLRPLGGGH